jgi:hypothetical protein
MVPTLKNTRAIDNVYKWYMSVITSREYQHQESIYVLFKPTNLENLKNF